MRTTGFWIGLGAALALTTGCVGSQRDESAPAGGNDTDGTGDVSVGMVDEGPGDPSDGESTGEHEPEGSTSDTGEPPGDTGGSDPDPGDTGDDDTPTGDGALGESCSHGSECMSGSCWTGPMIGACSECEVDADCQVDGAPGTCAFDFDLQYAVCTDGGLGAMCESDDSCAPGLVCAEAIDTGGLFDGSYCSACADDSACGGDEMCSPVYIEGGIGGWLDCVEVGTVPNDQGCPLDASNEGIDAACASGHCSAVNAGGIGIWVGVCGECESAADCGGGTCQAANAGLMGVTGAQCL